MSTTRRGSRGGRPRKNTSIVTCARFFFSVRGRRQLIGQTILAVDRREKEMRLKLLPPVLGVASRIKCLWNDPEEFSDSGVKQTSPATVEKEAPALHESVFVHRIQFPLPAGEIRPGEGFVRLCSGHEIPHLDEIRRHFGVRPDGWPEDTSVLRDTCYTLWCS